MTSPRPFSADSNKLAYAQVFTRTVAAPRSPRDARPAALRGLAARLHRPARPTR